MSWFLPMLFTLVAVAGLCFVIARIWLREIRRPYPPGRSDDDFTGDVEREP